MSQASSYRRLCTFGVFAILGGAFVFFKGADRTSTLQTPAPQTSTDSLNTQGKNTTPPPPSLEQGIARPQFQNASLTVTLPAPSHAPEISLRQGILDWETQLAELGKSAPDPLSHARAVFALIPKLPDEALETAAERALAQLSSSDFRSVAAPVLLNASTHGRVLSVLFADLMERPPSTSLPLLLELAQHTQHAFAPFALDNLRLLLSENFGADWNQWDVAIRDRLRLEAAIAPRVQP
ncbi:MAG: hypothetical protein WCO60_12605 [Verrucomicrobiota bacterium]